MNTEVIKQNLIVRRIFSGGDHSFVSVVDQTAEIIPEDFRQWSEHTQIWYLTLELAQKCAAIQCNDTVDLVSIFDKLFRMNFNQSCFQELISSIEIIFKHLSCMNASFLLDNNKHFCCTSKHHGINVELAETTFDAIRKIEHESLKHLVRF